MRSRLPLLLVAAVLSLAACGGEPGESVGSAGPDPTGPAPATGAGTEPPAEPTGQPDPAAPEALAFTIETVDGEPFDGASLAGEPVLFWFWASWCPRCHAQAPAMLELAEDVTVIGVTIFTSPAEAPGFIARTGTGSLTHLRDDDGVLSDYFDVKAQETLVLLDADGEVVLKGIVRPDEVRERLT